MVGAGVRNLPGVPRNANLTPQVGHPAAPPAAPRPAAGGGGPHPIVPDAQYLAEQAQRQFERQQQINAYNAQTKDDQTNTQEAIRRLLGKVGDDRSNISNQANSQGLFYSGQLGKRLGDYQAEVTRQQGDLTTGQSQREAAREAARQAILQGRSIEEAAALAAAADRQVQRDQADAAAGILTAADTSAPAPAVQTVKPKSKPKPKPKRRRPVAQTSGSMYGRAGVRNLLAGLR